MTKILACVDGSPYTPSVCDHAAWAAARTGDPVELLHAIGRRDIPSVPHGLDLSGSLDAGETERLMAELAEMDARRAKLMQGRGRAVLEDARARVQAAGVAQAEVRLRNGDLLDALAEAEGDARLTVIGKRGSAADFAQSHLGSNLERVVRASRKPVLVASRDFKPVERFLIAFDGSASATRAVEAVAGGTLLRGLDCRLLTVGANPAEANPALDGAAARLREAGYRVQVDILPGEPEEVIPDHAARNGVDLLVMGAYGHSRIRQLIVGSTTTAMVRACRIPVLMVR
ncbi:universal stress protein [Azospirillum sp. SYSU D00513]|uniref:universal stress protein n=1 Tax=Azospirillum sp. SYSU D00513 TaxID=2812561 RepID=UPI001A96293F|nr:universal stress protein [Azospirillum sp. SYSU D00513]